MTRKAEFKIENPETIKETAVVKNKMLLGRPIIETEDELMPEGGRVEFGSFTDIFPMTLTLGEYESYQITNHIRSRSADKTKEEKL